VTYADNTSEPAELAILPYPIFEGGKKIAMQRGAGMCVIKSTPDKEYAAATFLKWFTRPENNLRFVASTGYLPVTEEAFGEIMSTEIKNVSDVNIKKLLHTGRIMQQEYEFYIPPLFDGIDELQTEYDRQLREVTADSRTSYLDSLSNSDKNSTYNSLAPAAFDDFINRLSKI
jgi:multiple sugar transport system substrate-binding protein